MFDDLTTSVLAASIRGGAARQAAISQNVANADTPGYKRLSVSFEGALAQALLDAREGAARGGATPAPAGADGGWWDQPATPGVAGRSSAEVDAVTPETTVVADTTVRVDGSNVDPDDEMAQLAANQLAYDTSTSLLAARFGQYRSVIKGG